MLVTANGHTVVEATIREALQGAWLAELQVDHTEELTGAVTIAFGDVDFVGTVVRSGVNQGRSRARVIGGAGGLSTLLPGRSYTGVSLGTVLGHILTEAGETLSEDGDDIAGQFVPRWVRPAGTAARAVAAVAAHLGLAWRTLRDGTVWIGTDTYPEIEAEYTETDRDAITGAVLIAPASPKARPGVSLDGDRVTGATTMVGAAGLRQKLSLDDDRLVRVITRIVESVAKRHLDTRALYPCTVLGQNANGTLELMPDDAIMGGGLGGLSSIPIRYGAPGETVEVSAGVRVLLGFEGGDPSRPVAALWESGGVPTLRTVDADAIELGAGEGTVIRAGDNITVGTATGVVILNSSTHPSGISKVEA